MRIYIEIIQYIERTVFARNIDTIEKNEKLEFRLNEKNS